MKSAKQNSDSLWTIPKFRLILGGFVIQLVLGYFYLWSPIGPYVTSYFRKFTPGLSNKLTNIVQPSLGFAKTLSMPFGVMISSKLGYCWTTIILGFVLAVALISGTLFNNFWWFYFNYSIIGGIINGCLVMLPIYQIQKVFAKHKGVATGIAFSGYGLGSMIWSSMSFALINPQNSQASLDSITKEKFFNQEVVDKVPFALKVLGVTFFLCLTVSSIITFQGMNKETEKKKETSESQTEEKPLVDKATDLTPIPQQIESTYKQLLFSKSYIIIFSMAFLSSLFPMMMINNYKQLSLRLHNDDKFITLTVVSATSIANGLARVVWGLSYDKIGFHFSFLINQIMQLILILLYFILSPIKLGFTIIVALLFFCQGGSFVLFPLYILEYFGNTDGQKVYGFVHYAFSTANLAQYFIFYNLESVLGLPALFSIFFATDSIACLIKFAFNKKQKTQ